MTPEEKVRLRIAIESLLANVRAGVPLGPHVPVQDDGDLGADIRAAEAAAWKLMEKMGIPVR